MANNAQLARMRQMGRHNDRQIFSSSDDNAMMKQIEATHSPDGREVDVKPVLVLIEEILHRASPDIDGVINVQLFSSLFFHFYTRLTSFPDVVFDCAYFP